MNISLFIYNKSLLSIPGLRGIAPKNIATSASLNAIAGSLETITLLSKGNAQSYIYIFIPSNSVTLSGSSSNCKENF